MVDEKRPLDGLVLFDIFSELYPTPQRRKSDAVECQYPVGSIVKVLVGSRTGKVGVVVVDRNDNYIDSEPYCSDESVGIRVDGRIEVDSELEKGLISGGISPKDFEYGETLWFDDWDQLKFIRGYGDKYIQ